LESELGDGGSRPEGGEILGGAAGPLLHLLWVWGSAAASFPFMRPGTKPRPLFVLRVLEFGRRMRLKTTIVYLQNK